MHRSIPVPRSQPSTAATLHPLRRRIARALMRSVSTPGSGEPHAPLPRDGVFRILVCRVSHSLGNTLLLTPLLRELETVYPGAEVDVVTRSPVARDVFSGFYNVRDILVLPAWGLRHPLHVLGVLRRMRRTRYDLAIDTDPRSQTSRALIQLAHATRTLGFISTHKRGRLTHPVDAASSVRKIGQRPVFLLRSALGAAAPHVAYPLPDIRLGAAELADGRDALARVVASRPASGKTRGVIAIFANATGHKKRSREWWTRFLNVLEPGCPDHAFVEILPASGHSLLASRYPAYFSSSVRKLGAVISSTSLYISADCGVMHLACASGAVTLGIFGNTNEDEWAPYGPRNHTIDAAPLTPEAVAEAALAWVNGSAPGPV